MNLFEMRKAREAAITKAESFVASAENASRLMTENEQKDFDAAMAEANSFTPQIQSIEAVNTLRAQFPKGLIPEANVNAPARTRLSLSAAYVADFWAMITSKGAKMGAALYEGSDAAGGYAVTDRMLAMFQVSGHETKHKKNGHAAAHHAKKS